MKSLFLFAFLIFFLPSCAIFTKNLSNDYIYSRYSRDLYANVDVNAYYFYFRSSNLLDVNVSLRIDECKEKDKETVFSFNLKRKKIIVVSCEYSIAKNSVRVFFEAISKIRLISFKAENENMIYIHRYSPYIVIPGRADKIFAIDGYKKKLNTSPAKLIGDCTNLNVFFNVCGSLSSFEKDIEILCSTHDGCRDVDAFPVIPD